MTIPSDPGEVIMRAHRAGAKPALGAFLPVEQRMANAERAARKRAATDLEEVVETFRRWLYLPDAGPVLAVLATVAANRLAGDPVWLLLVAASGGGKTEILGSISGVPNVHWAATLTEAALLSGTPARQKASDARGGLLRDVGDFGILVCKDFTSVLAQNRDTRAAVLAALREIYDGRWTRHVGTDGGRVLHWEGKLGFVGGCTPAIDSAHGVIAAMGERYVTLRIDSPDDDEQAKRALKHYGRELTMRAELAKAVSRLIDGLPKNPPVRALAEWEEQTLIGYATFTARSRSGVDRDSYSREVESVPSHEAATRLALTFRRLLAGLELIGAGHDQAWSVLARIALDCMPATRLAVLKAVRKADDQRTADIAVATELPTQTARRALEDLTLHGVVTRQKQTAASNAPDLWSLTDWARDRWPTVPENQGARSGSSPDVPETPDNYVGPLLPNSHPSPLTTEKRERSGSDHRGGAGELDLVALEDHCAACTEPVSDVDPDTGSGWCAAHWKERTP